MQNNKTKKPIWFVEYKNLPSSGWGRIAKYGHEWYCDNDQGISIIRFHDKKKITLISTEYHSCEVDEVPCTRNRRRSIVTIPKMVKFYSKKREELIQAINNCKQKLRLLIIFDVMVGIGSGECMQYCKFD